MNYFESRFFENLNIDIFRGCGEYEIPEIKPTKKPDCDFIGWNYAKSEKRKEEKGIHFFLHDYQFERLWRNPEKYLELIMKFRCVMTPDFSLYTDFPKAMQIYNHYRKHWLGAFWQSYGADVIPTVSWSDKRSFEWCFDGDPQRGVVAVSSVGTQRDANTKRAFLDGWFAMLDTLEPEAVIFHGSVPEECKGNIVRIKSFQDKFKEVTLDGR